MEFTLRVKAAIYAAVGLISLGIGWASGC